MVTRGARDCVIDSHSTRCVTHSAPEVRLDAGVRDVRRSPNYSVHLVGAPE